MKRIPLSIMISIIMVLLVAGGALAATLNFRAHMQANEIIPLPTTLDDSSAQGQANFKISDDEMSISYKINVANIDKVTMAHIHMNSSVPGRNGPILVWLFPGTSSTAPGSPTDRIDGGLVQDTIYPTDVRGGFTWDQLLDFMRNEQVYVNVHSSDAPAGEINGHIH